MKIIPIRVKPAPRLQGTSLKTAGLVGKPIQRVGLTDSGVLRVWVEGAVIEGTAEELLPAALRRQLGHVLGGKTLGPTVRKFKENTPESEDDTYDQDSSAPADMKPEKRGLHPKTHETLRRFRHLPESEEQQDVSDTFPQDFPSDHPKEVALRKMQGAALKKRQGSLRSAAGDIVVRNVEVSGDQFPDDDNDPDAIADVTVAFTLKGKALTQLLGKQQRVLEKALKSLSEKQALALLSRGGKTVDPLLKAFQRPVNKLINDEARDAFGRGARIDWRKGFEFTDDTSYWSAKIDPKKQEILFEVEVGVLWKWA